MLPSPVHQPQIATLRGHGAPITCMAPLPAGGSGSGSGSWGPGSGSAPAGSLVTGSLDGRLKVWDVFSPACTATAKAPGPVAHMTSITDPLDICPPGLGASALVVAGGNALQLLDLRSMRVAALATQPERAEAVLCLAQWGADVVAGGRDGARAWDLRMPGAEPRLLLRDHARQVWRRGCTLWASLAGWRVGWQICLHWHMHAWWGLALTLRQVARKRRQRAGSRAW